MGKAVAQPHPQLPPSPVPWGEVSLVQVGAVVVLVTPLYFAPGVRRLARSARFALLEPVPAWRPWP
ncbi:hypothetical protein [Streptomyces ureilyticus]|uniref:Uncharacterized protein n=1 Tax=Streptomyces ureilyticus TaxID=1775131 RepID=A0ABX0DVS8_9ACTN|nr:hypothetical protein [Streptomyces ureilyticus]NGO44589.1 hypothetical protein [Streptomyces ureilyticus]